MSKRRHDEEQFALMSLQDWSKVDDGEFHSLHFTWIASLTLPLEQTYTEVHRKLPQFMKRALSEA